MALYVSTGLSEKMPLTYIQIILVAEPLPMSWDIISIYIITGATMFPALTDARQHLPVLTQIFVLILLLRFLQEQMIPLINAGQQVL